MEELRKYQLGTHEWNALGVFQKILAVQTISNCDCAYFNLLFFTGTSRFPAALVCREDTNFM